MEWRLRKLLPSRRVKSSPSELDLHSQPYQTAPTANRAPVFLHQALRDSGAQSRNDDDPLVARSLSYNAVPLGKPPTFGGRPQKGNGPVRLQTSRRLSSGELLVTSQDHQRTLEDIKEGDYIVGGKQRRESQQSRSPSVLGHSSQAWEAFSSTSNSPRTFSRATSSPWIPSPRSDSVAQIPASMSAMLSSPSSVASVHQAYPPSSSMNDTPNIHYPAGHDQTEGLGISDYSVPLYNRYSVSRASPLDQQEVPNPTLQALWKAECGRLNTMYRQAGIDRHIAEPSRDYNKSIYDPTSNFQSHQYPPTVLQPRNRLSLESRADHHTKRFSSLSHNEGTMHDEYSDESSHKRLSLISSAGASSSYTTSTSITEADLTTTREDLRRVVEDMRTTYLRALDAQEPSFTATKSKSTKKRKSKTNSSPVNNDSQHAFKPPSEHRQSWQSSTGYPTGQNHKGKRSASYPVAGIATLPVIEASPAKSGPAMDSECDLKRADSMTLGELVAPTKRDRIRKKRISRSDDTLQPSTPPHSPPLTSQPTYSFLDSESEQEAVEPNKDFEDLYRDLFESPGTNVWQTDLVHDAGSPAVPPSSILSPAHMSPFLML